MAAFILSNAVECHRIPSNTIECRYVPKVAGVFGLYIAYVTPALLHLRSAILCRALGVNADTKHGLRLLSDTLSPWRGSDRRGNGRANGRGKRREDQHGLTTPPLGRAVPSSPVATCTAHTPGATDTTTGTVNSAGIPSPPMSLAARTGYVHVPSTEGLASFAAEGFAALDDEVDFEAGFEASMGAGAGGGAFSPAARAWNNPANKPTNKPVNNPTNKPASVDAPPTSFNIPLGVGIRVAVVLAFATFALGITGWQLISSFLPH